MTLPVSAPSAPARKSTGAPASLREMRMRIKRDCSHHRCIERCSDRSGSPVSDGRAPGPVNRPVGGLLCAGQRAPLPSRASWIVAASLSIVSSLLSYSAPIANHLRSAPSATADLPVSCHRVASWAGRPRVGFPRPSQMGASFAQVSFMKPATQSGSPASALTGSIPNRPALPLAHSQSVFLPGLRSSVLLYRWQPTSGVAWSSSP
jgi:hypothetical protein